MKLGIKKLDPKAVVPQYQTHGSVGFDLHAISDDRLEPGERKLIDTGLAFVIPSGYEVQIRPRSGLALKHGVTVINTPGTIDWDYRGPIKVLLINLGDEPFLIKAGDRIAQAVVKETVRVEFEEVEEISGTQRGSGGFGSTGVQ